MLADERQIELTRRSKARVGTVIDGKWTLDELLGVGGMAVVYAGTHRNGKRGAVKVLHPHEAVDPAVKARFLREGYVANKVAHPGAVSILDDDESPDGVVYLVMELLEGQTVETRCPPGTTMAVGDVLVMTDQVLDALVAAHDKGIIHRDLKPSNLFLTHDGSIKLLDFGIARLHELTAGEGVSRTTTSTMGTPGFMPPEQARGKWEEVDARLDLWAMGATMYTLLTGKWLHDEGTLNEQLLAAMKPCPPMKEMVPDIPDRVAQLIDKSLAFAKENRWASAAAMQAEVRDTYEALTGRAPSLSPRLKLAPALVDDQVGAAPTLAAPPGSSPSVRASTDAPVVAGSTHRRPRAKRGVTIAVGVGAALLLGIIAVVAFRGPKQVSSDRAPSATVTVAPTVTAPLATTVVDTAQTTEKAPLLSASIAPSGKPNITGPRPKASASASSAPSAAASVEVDIYGRRQ